MERKFVKERIWWLLSILLLTMISFTSLPLWNDGSNFLFRLYDEGLPYVDPFWNRWVDALIQLPAWLSVLAFGPSQASMWIFKFSLLLFPPLLLMVWITHLSRQQEKKAVILSSYALAWLLPLLLLFPITSMVPTLLAATIILSLLFKKNLETLDICAFTLSHLIIFFGHEAGILILVVMLVFGLINFRKVLFHLLTGRVLAAGELLFLIMLFLFKRARWDGKLLALTSGFDWNDLINYPMIITLIPIVSLITIFGSPIFKRAIGGLFLFYIFSSIYILWGNSFYHMAMLGRLIVLPMIILLFLILKLKKNETPGLDHFFWGSSFLFIFALMLKGHVLWKEFDKRLSYYDTSAGCTVIKKTDLEPWSVPEWTLPYLSIVRQHSYNPNYILVSEDVSKNGKCLRLGNSLIVGHGLVYNQENFAKKIKFNTHSNSTQQMQIEIPFYGGFPQIRIYSGELLEIFDQAGSKCLLLNLSILQPAEIILKSGEKIIWKKLVNTDLVEKIIIEDSYPVSLNLSMDPVYQVIQVNSITACLP